MLSIKHVEDYLCERVDDSFEISLNTEGHRRLNHQVKLPLNLNQGYNSKYCNSEEEHRSIEVLLKWLIKKSPEKCFERATNGAQFVSRRGVLSRIAAGEHLQAKGEWSALCEKRKGVVFIEEMPSDIRKKTNENMSDAEKRSTHMGRRFEKYLLLPPPTAKNGEISSEKSDVRMVIEGRLEKDEKSFKLLYSGEVDAIDKEGKYVEMKTQRDPMDGYWFWREKSLRWWLQSKLVGVDYLLIGLKSREGYCRQIRKEKLNFFESHGQWNGQKCLDFLHKSLDFIQENVPEGEVKRIEFKNGQLWCHNQETSIISKEFIEYFNL